VGGHRRASKHANRKLREQAEKTIDAAARWGAQQTQAKAALGQERPA